MCAKSDCTQSGTCRTSSYFFISAYFSIYHEPLLRQITGNWLSWCCIVLKLPVALSGLFICFCFLLSWSLVFALCLSTSRAAQFCSMLQSRLHFFFLEYSYLLIAACGWRTLEREPNTGIRSSFSYFLTRTLNQKPQGQVPDGSLSLLFPATGQPPREVTYFSHTPLLYSDPSMGTKSPWFFLSCNHNPESRPSPTPKTQRNHFSYLFHLLTQYMPGNGLHCSITCICIKP